MRTLRARQIASGKWLRRIDTGLKTEADFAKEVAAEFEVAITDVAVEVAEMTEADYATAVTELASGSHAGLGVIAPPPKAIPPNPYGFRQALVGALDGTDQAAKLNRAKALRQKYPGFTEPFLRALQGPELNAEEAWWVKALWADARIRVGSLTDEIITAGERDRIEALAPNYGISLV